MIVLGISLVLTLSLSPVALSQNEKPPWAEKTNYLEYDVNGTMSTGGTDGENAEYSYSGSYRVEVLEARSDGATVQVNFKRKWENGNKPSSVTEPGLREENWRYEQSKNPFYLDSSSLKDLKEGKIPATLENIYEGTENVKVPYGELETYHVHRYENSSFSVTTEDYYYEVDSGLGVKFHIIQEVSQGGYFETVYELNDTDMLGEGGYNYWIWTAAGALALIIAAAVFMTKSNVR